MTALIFILSNLTWLQGLNYKDSVTLYRHILRLNPGCTMARNNLGIIYLKNSHLDKSIDSFEQTIELDPDYIMAYINLGMAYFKKGDNKKALESLNRGLQIKNNIYTDHLYHNLGIANYKNALSSYLNAFIEDVIKEQEALPLKPAREHLEGLFKASTESLEKLGQFALDFTKKGPAP